MTSWEMNDILPSLSRDKVELRLPELEDRGGGEGFREPAALRLPTPSLLATEPTELISGLPEPLLVARRREVGDCLLRHPSPPQGLPTPSFPEGAGEMADGLAMATPAAVTACFQSRPSPILIGQQT